MERNPVLDALGYIHTIIIDMGHGIAADGHAATKGKQTPEFPDGTFILEAQWNHPCGLILKALAEAVGFRTTLVVPELWDVPLYVRSQRANADFHSMYDSYRDKDGNLPHKHFASFVSIHYDALGTVWDKPGGTPKGGPTTFYYPGSTEGEALAKSIMTYLPAGTTQYAGRGAKPKSFHVVRETDMPAVLCECGFMDVMWEAKLMLNPTFQQEQADNILRGICGWLGLDLDELREAAGQTSIPAGDTEEHLIRGFTEFDPVEAQDWLWSHNADAPEVAQYYHTEGKRLNIDALGAISQAAKETGFFRFGGAIDIDAHNPCGLGVTGTPGAGQRFDTWADGVKAHIQHLFAYCTTDDLTEEIIDERFSLVTRGIAPTWEQLGGRWAVPGYDTSEYSSFETAYAANDTYGHSILKHYRDKLVEYLEEHMDDEPEPETPDEEPEEPDDNETGEIVFTENAPVVIRVKGTGNITFE